MTTLNATALTKLSVCVADDTPGAEWEGFVIKRDCPFL